MKRTSKNRKPLVSIDWTGVQGDTPFYEDASGSQPGRYAVAVDTKVIKWNELKNKYGNHWTGSVDLLTSGTNQILNFYNKESQSPSNVFASIPAGPSGTFVPLRPSGTIKVLVTIPDLYHVTASDGTVQVFDFGNSIPDKPMVTVGAYDEIQLNTFNFTKKAQNISKLLKKYNKRAKNFDGRIYDFNFDQQADKITNCASMLVELVNTNKFDFLEDQSDLVIVGVSSSYTPLYAQINDGSGFENLGAGFEKFKQSNFVDSNTMFIYKHFEEISTLAVNAGATAPAAEPDTPADWQKFLNDYIKFPQAIIEYNGGRPNTPEPDPDLKREIAKSNSSPITSADELHEMERRIKSRKFKEAMEAKQKASRDWIGDNVLGNLDKTINELHTLENFYHKVLDKTGMTYIVKAALRCLESDLPFDAIKSTLGDIRSFTVGVLEILKIPVIDLDDIFPTVDIMWDIMKTVFKAIYEAVKKALWEMLKQIIYTLLDNCNNPCQAGFGGVNLGKLLEKPPLEALAGLTLPALAVAGDAAAKGVQQGLSVGASGGNLNANSQKFLNNLNKKVSADQINTLVTPIQKPVGQATSAAKEALTNSPIGQFFEKASEALSCGETKELLEGKASPAAIKIIKTLAESIPGLKELLGDQESINDFFENAGKLIDEDELIAQIEALSEFDPDPCGNLSDREDSELRCAILADKEVPENICSQQVGESRKRAIERAKELQKFLEDPSKTLQDAIPPIYCTYENGKIVEGLVSNDHPSFTFMLKRTLDTTFTGVYNQFTYDVLRIPDVMQLEVAGPRKEVKRVIDAPSHMVGDDKPGRYVDGAWRMMNPEFEMAVEQGHKPKPPYWKCDAQIFGANASDLIQIPLWLEKTIEYNLGENDGFEIPTRQVVYCPGMSGSGGVYGQFQTSYFDANESAPVPTPLAGIDNELARRRLAVDRRSLQLSIENSMKTDLQQFGGPAGDVLEAIVNEARFNPEFAAAIRNLGLDNLFGPERYAVSLTSMVEADANKDKFSVRITGDMSSGEDAQIYKKMFIVDIPQAAQDVIHGLDLDTIADTLELTPTPTVEPPSLKEKRFVSFLQDIWSQGEHIYSGSINNLEILTRADYPVSHLFYCRGFAPQATTTPGLITQELASIGRALLADQLPSMAIKSLYEELLRDLTAATLTQVGTSKLLEDDAVNLFSLINFAPLPREGCGDLSLLGLEIIKDEIFDRYKDALCIEKSFPNVTGLGDNRDNAFESAALYGIVKATVRLYALEIVLKTLPTFSALQVYDLDDVFIVYLREHITGEIRAKEYLDDFIAQTLKAYNLLAAGLEGRTRGLTQTTSFEVALDYFIRQEMKYAVEKILTISGLAAPQKAINNLLIQNDDAGWLPDFDAGAGIREGPFSDTYHVNNADQILGIKDPTNGSFITEKYIRVEANENWSGDDSPGDKKPFDHSRVYSVTEFGAIIDNLFGGAQNTWPQLTPPTPPPTGNQTDTRPIVGDDDCGGTGPMGQASTTGTSTSESIIENLGRYFKSVRYGLRLVCKSGNNAELDNVMGMPPSNSSIFNLEAAKKNKSYLVADDPSVSALIPDAELNRFVFPVVCVERDVDLETNISTILADNTFFSMGYEAHFPQLLCMLKKTNEYNFMFDYCFPIKRLVSLAALYNVAYVLPFPGTNGVFTGTKEQLRMSFGSMLQSGNYVFNDLQVDPQTQALNIANGKELTGFDFAMMAIQFLFGLMKGAGEAFSPNIAIARKIQVLTEMIGPGLVKAVNKAKEVGNRANKLAGGDGAPLGGDISECDLPPPFPLPEIPIILISLSLVPVDLFFPLAGPPLGPLGYLYLTFFHSEIAVGRLILGKSENEKEKDRCALRNPTTGNPLALLTNLAGDCPVIQTIPKDISGCESDNVGGHDTPLARTSSDETDDE